MNSKNKKQKSAASTADQDTQHCDEMKKKAKKTDTGGDQAEIEETTTANIELLGPQENHEEKLMDSLSAEDFPSDGAELADFDEVEEHEPSYPLVSKPDSNKKFWACPNPVYSTDAWVWTMESKKGFGKDVYLITKSGLPNVPMDQIKRVHLVLCKYHGSGGEYFVFWMPALTADEDPSIWITSKHKAVEMAKDIPIRMYTKKINGRLQPGWYRAIPKKEARDQYTRPGWPEEPFVSILETAFKGRIISGPKHPILAEFSDEARDEQ